MPRVQQAITVPACRAASRRLQLRLPPAWRASGAGLRLQIGLAFGSICAITVLIGIFSTLSLRNAGRLVASTFDRSLISINYALEAATDFANLEVKQERLRERRALATPAEIEDLTSLLHGTIDDVRIARERASSAAAVTCADSVLAAVSAWKAASEGEGEAAAAARRATARLVRSRIDTLVNLVAGDAFVWREQALGEAHRSTRMNSLAALGAVLLSGLTIGVLARRILRPVSAASAIAERIAAGDLDVEIPPQPARGDELARLLRAMAAMRDSIRAALEREIAQRRSAEMRLVDAIESAEEGVVLIDAEQRVSIANTQARRYLESDGRIEPSCLGWLGPEQFMNGRWLRISRTSTRDGGWVAIVGDITAIKQREAELRDINDRLDAALANMSQGLCFYDNQNRLKLANRQVCAIYGLAPEAVRVGMLFRQAVEMSFASGAHLSDSADALHAEMVLAQAKSELHLLPLRDGRIISIMHKKMHDGGWVATHEDITERHQAQARILHMARHDALTGLANRVMFAERLEQAIAFLGRGRRFAVLCLDIDNFKSINDTLGHQVGDALLRQVAERFEACTRETDTIARLGGDEFAVVQTNVHESIDAGVLADRLIAAARAPFEIDGQALRVTASCGIAIAPVDGVSSQTLLKNADIAL